jgi:hypothetical protein
MNEEKSTRYGESHIRLLEGLTRESRVLAVDSPACGVYVGLVADGLVRFARCGKEQCILSITWEGLMALANAAKKEHEVPRTNGDVGLCHLAVAVDEIHSDHERLHAFTKLVYLLLRLRDEENVRRREAP